MSPILYSRAAEPSPEFPGWAPGKPLGGDLQVTIGDVTFGVVNDDRVSVRLAGLEGWFGIGSTGQVEERSGDDGGWLSPAHARPRVVRLSGRIDGAEWAHLNDTIDRVVAAVPIRGLAPLYVTDHGDTKVVWVRQEGEPLITRKGKWATVSLSMVAPDPRKYSAEVTSASTGLPQTSGGLSLPLSTPVTVGATTDAGVLVTTNSGNYATRPMLRVIGPAPAFTITHRTTGRSLTSSLEVPAGRFLELDTDRRRALLDGTEPRPVTGAWFEYEPGDNEVAFSAVSYNPDALLVSEHRHAWR